MSLNSSRNESLVDKSPNRIVSTNRIMQPTHVILIVTGVLSLFVLVAWIASNPLRRSDERVRAWLLTMTPIGSSVDEVHSFLERREWYTDGYRTTLPRPARDPFLAGKVGGYQGLPWYVSVAAFWEFDSSDRLVDVRIERTMESP